MPGSSLSGARASPIALVALLSVATFLNAALLFAVQPMFTKMVLPLLGGTPSVWNTCLLFFQGALLVGYLYAHASSRWLRPAPQAWLHVTMLAASLLFLPLAMPSDVGAPPGSSTAAVVWLLRLLTVTLGFPFMLLAAGAPMVQRWFASTRHDAASNPYFLYAASNLGSFAALIAYPTLIEPQLRLSEQSLIWQGVYVGLIALLGVSAWATWRWRRNGTDGNGMVMQDGEEERHVVVRGGPPRPPRTSKTDNADLAPPPSTITLTITPTITPTRAWRLRWVLLSFAPSSLLLGVTTFLGTDIASVPFLWVAPLALYLLTFVVVFARRPMLGRGFMLVLHLFLALGLLVIISANPTKRLTAVASLHLLTFFVTAMVCHRELADARPRAEYLTEFYLWMSLGGLLGGVYNVLLAPALYDRVLEYPFAMIIALGLRPAWRSVGTPHVRPLMLDLLAPLALFGVIIGGFYLPTPPADWGNYGVYFYLGVAALVAASFYKRPLRLALAAGAIFLAADLGMHTGDDNLFQVRSFFGVYRVRRWEEYSILQHGTTTHGAQSITIDRRTEPLTYYHREGPLGDIFRLVTDSLAPRAVALVGLGAGTTACYSRPGERWTYFEIDPVVVTIAQSPSLFTYLTECQPEVRIVLGDARRSLMDASDSSFDLIALDAFSSDAIPVHLITREALQLYLRKLRPGGVVAFHISNRYLDLRPVLVELARDARLAGALLDRDVNESQRRKLYYGSRWVTVARNAYTLAPLVKQAGWQVLAPSASVRVWTDDYSDVLGVMRWK